MHVHICVYIYIYIFIYLYLYVFIYIYTYTYIYKGFTRAPDSAGAGRVTGSHFAWKRAFASPRSSVRRQRRDSISKCVVPSVPPSTVGGVVMELCTNKRNPREKVIYYIIEDTNSRRKKNEKGRLSRNASYRPSRPRRWEGW